jgi:signal transduction histidine kinase
MEEGSRVLEPRPFDMENTVRTTFYSFKAPCLERELRVKLELQVLQQLVHTQLSERCQYHSRWPAFTSPDSPQFKLVGDPQRLRQVMSHYASNAIKHSHRGGDILVELEYSQILLDESLMEELEDNEKGLAFLPAYFFQHRVGTVHVMLSVSDKGVGIPREHHANVFKAYTEIDAGALSTHKGSGLGLSVSRSLMQLMKGQVGFTSEENLGSKFFFEIDMDLRLMRASTSPEDDLDALHMVSAHTCAAATRQSCTLTVMYSVMCDDGAPGSQHTQLWS